MYQLPGHCPGRPRPAGTYVHVWLCKFMWVSLCIMAQWEMRDKF